MRRGRSSHFAHLLAVVLTLAICAMAVWLAYWLLDNVGAFAFGAYCLLLVVGSLAYAIRADIRRGRYRFRDLPGALFRRAPH